MNEPAFWARFVVGALATWRLTHLLAKEQGPAGIAARLRARLGTSWAGGILDCFGCVSLWVAVPFAFFAATTMTETVMSWLALGGAAFLLECFVPEPLIIERLPASPALENDDGLLQSEALSDVCAACQAPVDPAEPC